MNGSTKNYSKSLVLIFVGLLCSTFALNLFDIAGISTSVYISAAGYILMIVGIVKMKDINPRFKVTAILLGACAIVTIGEGIYAGLIQTDIPNLDEITSTAGLTKLDQSVFVNVYVSLVIAVVMSVVKIMSVYYVLIGVREYCKDYCPDFYDVGVVRAKKYKFYGVLSAISTILLTASTLPVLRAYNQYVDNQISAVELASSSSITLIISIVSLVVGICYIVAMIKTLVYVYKVSNAPMTVPVIDAEASYVNSNDETKVEPTKKDTWDDEIK